MGYRAKIIVLLVCWCSSVVLFYAQENDSIQETNSLYKSLLHEENNFLDFLFYKYNNNLQKVNLGPYGSPYYYPGRFNLSIYKREEVPLDGVFNRLSRLAPSIKPFTNVTFVNAGRKEQLISVDHLQHFGKQANLKFNYQRIGSPGIYLNQASRVSSFNAETNFMTKANRYKASFKVQMNRDRVETNGGLTDREAFELATFTEKKGYDVHLLSSNADQRSHSFMLDQRFNLFNLTDDSITPANFYVGLNNSYSTYRRFFFDEDPTATIYDKIYFDSTASVDFLESKAFRNDIVLGLKGNKYDIRLWGGYEENTYYQVFNIDTSYSNTLTGAELEWEGDKLSLKWNNTYFVSGFRQSDVESSLAIDYEWPSLNKLAVKFAYLREEPSLFYTDYFSNHFQWRNTFDKQTTTQLRGSFYMPKLKLEFTGHIQKINSLLYFNESAEVEQNQGEASFSSFSITKTYRLSRLHFKTSGLYQVTSDAILLPLPDFIFRQLVYYENKLFKKTLKLRVGFNAYYTSDYYGYNYMPAISRFYVQSTQTLGDYPYLDLFISGHIKRMQFFLMYEHLNSGLNLTKAYLLPSYPILDGQFKVGLSWNMFD